MEIRLEEGVVGDAAIRARLDAWWRTHAAEYPPAP